MGSITKKNLLHVVPEGSQDGDVVVADCGFKMTVDFDASKTYACKACFLNTLADSNRRATALNVFRDAYDQVSGLAIDGRI